MEGLQATSHVKKVYPPARDKCMSPLLCQMHALYRISAQVPRHK